LKGSSNAMSNKVKVAALVSLGLFSGKEENSRRRQD